MKFDIVDFAPYGDPIKALYIDGKVYMAGDYYHDKIDEQIEAFVNGVEYTLERFDIYGYDCNYWVLSDENEIEDFCSYGAPFPEQFPFTEYKYEPTK